MRVALDEQIFAIQAYGGISRMFAELAAAFAAGVDPDVSLVPINAAVVNRYVLDDPALARALGVRAARNQWTGLAGYFGRVRRRSDADIVHNTFYLPHGLMPTGSARRIVTIHDMIPELMPHTRRRLDFITLKRRYVSNADHIICVSEATKQDLLKVYGIPRAPISVVHHGVDPRFRPDVPKEDFLPRRYVLFVGHRRSYKDADVLFRAFAALVREHPEMELLCVGGDDLSGGERAWLAELGIADRVRQRYLSDEQMASAYAHAEMFVFPSHFEGFGLPVLEAMACGTPAIIARATALPEVGGDAVAYFEPGDHDELARVMLELLEDPNRRAGLRERGLERVREFTWRAAAERTAAVYRAALAGH